MHSWNEYYTYLGYTYVLEHDEDGDVRKNVHIVLDTNKKEIGAGIDCLIQHTVNVAE